MFVISKAAAFSGAVDKHIAMQGCRSRGAGGANAPPTFGPVAPRWEHVPQTFVSVEWLYSDGKCHFPVYFLIHAVAYPSRCSYCHRERARQCDISALVKRLCM